MLKRQFCYAGKRQQVVVASKWAPIICLNYCKLGSSQQKQVCLADHADTQRNVLLHYQATCRLQPQVYWPLGSFRVFKKRGDTMSCTWMRCVHAKNEEKLYRLVLLDLVGWTLESLFTLIGRLYLQLSTLFFRDSEFMQEISILFGRTFPFKNKSNILGEHSSIILLQRWCI